MSGTWDGTAGDLTFQLTLTETGMVTWDAIGSNPITNPTVGLLVEYLYNGVYHGTADNDDTAVYPDEEFNTEQLIAVYIPKGTYNLTFEGSTGHESFEYYTTITCTFTAEPTEAPTADTTSPTEEPSPSPSLQPTPLPIVVTTTTSTTDSPTKSPSKEPTPSPVTTPIINTPAPVTPAPVTPAPVTPAPIPTPSPTKKPTAKPTTKPIADSGGSDSESFEFDFAGSNNDDSSGSSSTIWIIVSVGVVLLIIVVAACYVIRRRRADKQQYFDEQDVEVDELNDTAVGMSVVGTAPNFGANRGEEIVVEVNVHE